MKRILLLGNQGQLGQEIPPLLSTLGEVIGVGRKQLDLTQPEQIRQAIAQVHPHYIVNAAAYTAVDQAESEPDLAQAVNGTAPQIMAESAQKIGATLLHVSTDYVFDGRKKIPYQEDDTTNPLSVYGKSKLAGELGIQQSCDRYLIVRTAWVYGSQGKGNFVKTMLRLGAQRDQLRVVADQSGTPTWTRDLASAIAQLLIQFDRGKAATGIYHFTNSGETTWYNFALAIFEEARALGFPLQIQQVVPITTPDYPTPAQRPGYSVLSTQKLTHLLEKYPPYWRQSLRQMLKQLYDRKNYQQNV